LLLTAVLLHAAPLLLDAGRAAIDRYLLHAGPTAANPPHAAAAVDTWNRQTDTVPLHSAYYQQGFAPGAARRYASRRRQFDPKIAADLCPSADWSAVRTPLVAGGDKAAGSQRAYSLGSCTMGQTDGRIALLLNALLGRGA